MSTIQASAGIGAPGLRSVARVGLTLAARIGHRRDSTADG
jgi:hypothetical protein